MIKTAKELAAACVDAAKNHKTLSVKGCWGAPMTAANKARWVREQEYNRREDRAAAIKQADSNTFGFDCVCMIKGLLWGWDGSTDKPYGGAGYNCNGIPDIGEDAMIDACSDVSWDFTAVQVGEVVWMPGHIGVYIGDNLVVECTPIWEDGVQITACNCTKAGYKTRVWQKHGKLPYVTYEAEPEHWYRVRKAWEDAGSQVGAYKDLEHAKAGCPDGYGVFDWNGKCVYERFGRYESEEYPLEFFVRDIQEAIGAAVDGVAGPETLAKTPTLSAQFSATHPAVKPVQARLWELGYTEVGEADGEAGPKFTRALAHFQMDNGCMPTGLAEEWGKTWQKLLGLA